MLTRDKNHSCVSFLFVGLLYSLCVSWNCAISFKLRCPVSFYSRMSTGSGFDRVLGLALCVPSASVSSVFVVLHVVIRRPESMANGSEIMPLNSLGGSAFQRGDGRNMPCLAKPVFFLFVYFPTARNFNRFIGLTTGATGVSDDQPKPPWQPPSS